MKCLAASCIFLLLLSQAQSLKVEGNEVFDAILEKLRDADEVRLMPLRDLRIGFNRTVGLATIHGEAKLHDGVLTGLDSAQRIGDAQVITHDDGTMVFKCSLGMGVIDFHYRGTVTFMGMGPAVRMKTQTGYVSVDAEIRRNTDGSVDVTRFAVRDFEQLQVQFTGLGLLSRVTSFLVAPVVRVMRPLIRKTVEIGVRGIIQNKLPAIMDKIDFE